MQKRLSFLENKMAKMEKDFYEVGKSLKEIRDKRLYRVALFSRFEAYTKSRWDMGKSKAYRLINACNVIDNVSPIGDRVPLNEAQVRPLTMFEKDEQRSIWRAFLESGMELRALNISSFIVRYQTTKKKKTNDQTDIISDSYKSAVMLMMEQIKVAQNEGWQQTSCEAALMWNQVMREKILSQPDPVSGDNNG